MNQNKHYGIQSSTPKWINTWLTARTQREREKSEDKRVVPQGTVKGGSEGGAVLQSHFANLNQNNNKGDLQKYTNKAVVT